MAGPRPTGASSPFRFGPFELEAKSGELRNNGNRVSLPDQPLLILLALLERPAEVVTREELRQRLWPGDTFVDFEHGLNAAVKRLRDALGDSADTPRYIETLPRRGYRFVGAVEAGAPASGHSSQAAKEAWLPGWRITTAAAVVLLALGAAGWWAVQSLSAPRPASRSLKRLTFAPGLQTDVTWSPDGQRIAYVSDASGNFNIWVQPVAGGEPTPIAPSPAPETQLAWSPQGDQIVFRSERNGGGLFVVSASGGAARQITSFGYNPAWMPDGAEVVFTPGGSGSGLYAVVPDGSAPPHELLRDFLRAGEWRSPAVPRPDGNLSVLGWHRSEGLALFSVSVDGRILDIVRLPATVSAGLDLGAPSPPWRYQWGPGGSALFLEGIADGVSAVWRVPARRYHLSWEAAERLTIGPASTVRASLSPDGRSLAFTSLRGQNQAWVFPFDSAAGRLTGEGRPVTDEETTVRGLSLMPPDGRSILYRAQKVGGSKAELVITDLESGATRVVASDAASPEPSPDGSEVAYLLYRSKAPAAQAAITAETEFAAAFRDRSGSEHLLSNWSADEAFFPDDWRADGKVLLGSFLKRREPVALVEWPLHRGVASRPERVLLSDPTLSFWQSQYSPDERLVAFVASDPAASKGELGLLNLSVPDGQRWTRLANDHRWPDKPRWAPDGRTLYFISQKPTGYYNVWGIRIDLSRGVPVGEPFEITSFNSPTLMIDPDMITCEVGIRANRLALTMKKGNGNIWMLSDIDR